MTTKFDKITILKAELSQLTFSEVNRRRLDEKFRLEFSYNSNHLEGNTITYLDTKALLLKDIVANSYTFRELDEMKAHDAAFSLVKEWAASQERDISQVDIKELNKLILVKDFWKDAQTPDGLHTRREIKVGEYKEFPNSVRLTNGEIFHYAEPFEVPAKMQELMDWYNDEKTGLHPVTLAALFHHKFVLIHPFDDGNGRISRLMMNYILLRFGYPPIIIRSVDKTKYLNALRLADAGNFESFIDFIADQVIWSLELSIKAANGENIEDPDDWEKELSILAKSDDTIPERKTLELLKLRYKDSFLPLFKALKDKVDTKMLQLFENVNFNISVDNQEINLVLNKTNNIFENLNTKLLKEDKNQILRFSQTMLRYKKNGLNVFDLNSNILIRLRSYNYFVRFENKPDFIEKLFTQPLSEFEIQTIVNEWGKEVVNQIKENLNKNKV